jgi:RES domain-containing protein
VTAVAGVWHRALDPIFSTAPLSTTHTSGVASRFNAGAFGRARDPSYPTFRILYLAENPMVALFEAQALFGSPVGPGGVVPHPRRSLLIINVSVNLANVADLTDSAVRRRYGADVQQLTGDWRVYELRARKLGSVSAPIGIAPTQAIGAQASKAGHDGLLTVSARVPFSKILAVLADNLARPDQVATDFTGAVQTIS